MWPLPERWKRWKITEEEQPVSLLAGCLAHQSGLNRVILWDVPDDPEAGSHASVTGWSFDILRASLAGLGPVAFAR